MFSDRYPAAWTYHQQSSYTPGAEDFDPSHRPPPPHGFKVRWPVWKSYHGVPVVELPRPALPEAPLAEALDGRMSCRCFDDAPISVTEIAALLGGTYGIRGEVDMDDMGFELLERGTPSGGARYPLELYLLVRRAEGLERGVYHYSVRDHVLEQLRGPQPWSSVVHLFLDQPFLRRASAVVVLSAVALRTMAKYRNRGYRFLLIEAGHAAQNLNLLASSQGLGCLNLGGFRDDGLASLLGFDLGLELPLYGVALGRPATRDRAAIRQPSPDERD